MHVLAKIHVWASWQAHTLAPPCSENQACWQSAAAALAKSDQKCDAESMIDEEW